jgi:hypothetical protein
LIWLSRERHGLGASPSGPAGPLIGTLWECAMCAATLGFDRLLPVPNACLSAVTLLVNPRPKNPALAHACDSKRMVRDACAVADVRQRHSSRLTRWKLERLMAFSALATTLVFVGCSANSRTGVRPFVVTDGVEGGMTSRDWGDGASDPHGMRLG